MKKISLIFAFSLSTQFVFSQKAIPLFNQKNLDGWYAYEAETGKHTNASDLFKVENSMIRMFGKNAGYLMSLTSYQNFELVVEYKWNMDTSFARKTDKKNSGVMYLVPNDAPDLLWTKGVQFQIKDGATGDFVFLQDVTASFGPQRSEAGKSTVVKRIQDAANPDNVWNTLKVIVLNGKITQLLNGKLVNEAENVSVKEGRILLQYEGFPIDFRKVEIKKL